MTELLAAIEATALAQHLKASGWTYPLVNAGHILGIALLVGAVVPMDVAILRRRNRAIVPILRRWAIVGFSLAAVCGALLFATQATDYAGNGVFLAKMGLVGILGLNAAAHINASAAGQRRAAVVSLAAWPAVLVLGRLVGFS